jgi:hypothetical protein
MSTASRAQAGPLRVAMWSGPRNISTAMMRAWENRGDCAVSDEPLYAAYLAATGLDHPGREQIVAEGDCDWRRVVRALTEGGPPEPKPIWYQKHMTHHLLPGVATDWIHGLHNVFLIRDPAQVVESYLKSRDTVAPEDIGVHRQWAHFESLADKTGGPPPVIDADDFLREPEALLRRLCDLLGVAFTPRMLHWPPGRRASDGVWAPHWYGAVEASTGFEAWRERRPQLNASPRTVADACRAPYLRLRAHRLQAGT